MFQIPVENLDNIRKVRKKVKGILVDIGLDSCKELLKDLKGFDPGEKYFFNTSWGDISLWEPSGKKVRYRTKPYCCSLCKYSTKVLTSFKNHLHRYHEDEIDQELVIPCPNCVFSSQPKTVGRHFRMFHAPVRKVQNYTVNILGETKSRSDVISFTCLKCNFSNTLYYSMKKHVLVAHFHYLINSYFGLRTEEMGEQPKTEDSLSTEKMPPSDKYYCKKCNANASSQDALMYHILTSDIHRDLENKLRSVISEHIKKPGLLKQMHIAPKPAAPLAAPPNSSAPGITATSPCFRLALPQNGQSQTMVQPVTVASGTSGSLTHSPPAVVQSHVTLVSSPLPPSAPQPVFLSHGVPLTQSANPPVLPLSQPVGPINKSVGTGVLPLNQTIRPGALPLSQPVGPGVLSVSRPAGPGVLPVSPSVTPGVLQAVSPGVISVSRTVPSGVLPAGQMTPAGVIPSGQTATSGVLPAGQVVQSGVLPIGQTAPSGVLPTGLTVPSRVLPPGQTVPLRVLPAGQVVAPGLLSPTQSVSSGVLPVNQGINSGVLQLSQPVMSGVLPVGQPVRPGVLQLNQSVSTNILPASQPVRPGASQNTTFLTSGSILRQLIPTGKQVNGIPTYTLAPVSVTLPVPPGGMAAVPPSQMPIQLLPSGPAAQMASSVASMPSPPVLVSATQSVFVQASPSVVEANQALKQAKQWKTCPVCNELFPSNVYQVHMEVAHKHSESKSAEKLEPEKLAACAPFLKWMREKTVRCLSCKCLVSEEELIHHLLMHGLGCLFCPCTFHDIKGLSEHSRTMHRGKKKLPVDYSNKGFQLDVDANGNLMFPHLDFITILPKEELGEREVYLAILAGIHSKSLVPVYIKVRPQGEGASGSPGKQALTCPFCFGTFVTTEAYEVHLKERHHITPTVHTILKSPAFKCIHCCGVYTGNMTLAAIAIHLLRCRSAPKDSSSDLQIQPNFIENSEVLLLNGEVVHDTSFSVKRKLPDGHFGTEDQRDAEERPLVISSDAALAPEKVASVVPFKRQRNEIRTEGGPLVNDDALQILALNPKKYEDRSYEEKKQFLRDYFHKRPYPSKKEIELLSSLLWVWKIDVASFFGKRRYICMKAIKNHKPSVLLGFDMSELKNVKHRLNFEYEPQNL
ncbi:activity-dependent neuroprotector homeobox protein 2 isoform X1 [Canis lupus familiaris]|uniref:ADNP homeobox 2 n=3 Tax=Canis lupus familiaris TaxID=9615 RepID=A0A8C0PN98_CANLF|nr:activity-dependent neuroprotector homeobox protein 2 isoform X1 [Canis lupus familiaris]XP_025277704.1 activity-dependent neuroprotector homeobox protein 2 isoform X1 [Canis lupus dingo]XP_025277705.1 activity-dependent neuroprotector homeobox protein 2 isoform X1 [Canis lupus dingo]XP_025277706.1 activity-dependent neuroprotector homeobox protein 2 isoform X1 [Canis lupus dingo]XP_025277708.1 activity-dependent neuroprotector homeobox protein 2 isoform X1 [Canis lupus dingo]XP_035564656.1 